MIARTAARWRAFWFAPSPPEALASCRIVFCAGVLAYYAWADLAAWGEVSPILWEPVWVFARLGLGPAQPPALRSIQAIWFLALGASAAGLATRAATVVAFALGLYLIGLASSFGKVQHHHNVVVFVLGILALSRCGDAWSVDARRRAVAAAPSGEYTWPRRLTCVAIACVFGAAGVAKLRASGLGWVFSGSMRHMLLANQYHQASADPATPLGLWLAQVDWLCRVGAGAALGIEVPYPLALVSRRARALLVPAGFGLLVAIRLTMGPAFEPLMLAHVFWRRWRWDGGERDACAMEGRSTVDSSTHRAGVAVVVAWLVWSAAGGALADEVRAVTALGRIEPKDGVIRLAGPSRPSAVIGRLLVEEGDRVEAEQPLAEMDTIADSRARVAQAEAELRTARQALARLLPLRAQRMVAESALDDAQLRVDVATAGLQSARAALGMDVVRAPVAGQVIAVHARRGERVGPDGIVELAQNDRMYVVAEVYETDIGRVALGQRATASSPALAGQLTGRVERVGAKIGRMDVLGTDPVAAADARVVEVHIALDDSTRAASLSNLQVDVRIEP